jgi:hypothetical protein
MSDLHHEFFLDEAVITGHTQEVDIEIPIDPHVVVESEVVGGGYRGDENIWYQESWRTVPRRVHVSPRTDSPYIVRISRRLGELETPQPEEWSDV